MKTTKSVLVHPADETRKKQTFSLSLITQPLHSKLSTKVIMSFALLLLLFAVTHVMKFPGSVGYLNELNHGMKLLDMEPSFSVAGTYQRLEEFGEIGRAMYIRTMLTVDLIFPLSMFLFMFLLSKYTIKKLRISPNLATMLSAISVIYVTLDFLENISILLMLSNYPIHLDLAASILPFFTVGKRISMMTAVFLPLLLLIYFRIVTIIKNRFLTT